jgi:formylmethanofuran dehydrogenase subunit C
VSDAITLTLRAPLEDVLEFDGIHPERVAGLTEKEIAAMPVWLGGREVQLGALFSVQGERAMHIRMKGDLARVNRLGAGMSGGRIDVIGDVGDEAGMGMTGGVLHVSGKAGDRLCAATPGASKGMAGGEAIVLGAAGREAGARARRGLIVIGGDAGAHTARDIIAGTVVVFGRTGDMPGLRSKRGSIVAVGGIDVPSTYRYACTYEPTFVRLLLLYLRRAYQLSIPDEVVASQYRRFCGDAGDPGKGEILERIADTVGSG